MAGEAVKSDDLRLINHFHWSQKMPLKYFHLRMVSQLLASPPAFPILSFLSSVQCSRAVKSTHSMLTDNSNSFVTVLTVKIYGVGVMAERKGLFRGI